MQAAPGLPDDAVDRVSIALERALATEPRYVDVTVQRGCMMGYVDPSRLGPRDGVIAMVFLPTKEHSDELGLSLPTSLGFLRLPLDKERCGDCKTAPAALYLVHESFDHRDDLDGDRAGLVTALRNALFGLR